MSELEPLAISPREAARLTGYTDKYFEKQRELGKGPPAVKLPNGRIRYPWPQFKAWFEAEMKGATA